MKVNKNLYHHQGMHKGAPPSAFIKAKNLRKKMTKAEKKMWEFLKNKQLQGYKFRRQHPIHIYIVDFYCLELALVIEIDGYYHNEKAQIRKDMERSAILKFQDLYIIRFSNDEVIDSIGSVMNDLEEYIWIISSRPKGN